MTIPTLRVLAARIGIATGLILGVAMMTWLDRAGYRDTADDSVNFLDSLYYSTVSVTTTGYGDITPVSDSARLLTTFITTPARVIFLVLLVGTTLELLAGATRATRWRPTASGAGDEPCATTRLSADTESAAGPPPKS